MIKNYFALNNEQKENLYIETVNSCENRSLQKVRSETVNAILAIKKYHDAKSL